MANKECIGNASHELPRTILDLQERAGRAHRADSSNMHCEDSEMIDDVDSGEERDASMLHQSENPRHYLVLNPLLGLRSSHGSSILSAETQHVGIDTETRHETSNNCSPPPGTLATKDEYISQLEPLTCGICGEEYNSEHTPTQIADCKHIFGCHCIIQWFEMNQRNANKCPTCRQELFVTEYDSDDESDGGESVGDYLEEREFSADERLLQSMQSGILEQEYTSLPEDTEALDRDGMEEMDEFLEEVADDEAESELSAPSSHELIGDEVPARFTDSAAPTTQKHALTETDDEEGQGSLPMKRHKTKCINDANSELDESVFGFPDSEESPRRRLLPPRYVPRIDQSPPRYLLGPGRFTGLGQSARQRLPDPHQ